MGKKAEEIDIEDQDELIDSMLEDDIVKDIGDEELEVNDEEEEQEKSEKKGEKAEDEPEPKAEEEEEEDKPDRKVPLGELIAERKKRQELEERIAKEKAENDQKINLMMNKLQELSQPKEEEPELPSYEDDPLEHMRLRQEKIDKQLAEQNQFNQQQSQLARQQAIYQRAAVAIQSQEAEFSKTNPDYYEAVDYVRTAIRAQYEPLYRANGMNDAQIEHQLAQGEAQTMAQLVMQGIDVPTYIYKLAGTMKYQPKTAGDPSTNNKNIDENLDKIEKGLKHAGPGAQGGGHRKSDGNKKDSIGDLPLPEFEEAMNEMFPNR